MDLISEAQELPRAMEGTRGLFVATRHSMSGDSGGQQICTREFRDAIEAAGIELEPFVFALANGWLEKIARRLDRRPYRWLIPRNVARGIAEAASRYSAEFVFLNTVDLAPLATELKRLGVTSKVVLLSHGLESVDALHLLRTRNWRSDFTGLRRIDLFRLGHMLVEECRQRACIDSVLCLADFEAQIEKWLGSKRVLVTPRVLKPNKLNWAPVEMRIGFVGRLDHPPNLEGLRAVLEELQQQDIPGLELRLVGEPSQYGRELEARYSMIRYLGALTDRELESEAVSWSCTMNPIFCYARGASTKLAVLVGWGIPVVTTPQGARGYEWSSVSPIICDDAAAVAHTVVRIATDGGERRTAHERALRLLDATTTLEEVARRIKVFLNVSSPQS